MVLIYEDSLVNKLIWFLVIFWREGKESKLLNFEG